MNKYTLLALARKAQQQLPDAVRNRQYLNGTWQIIQWCPFQHKQEWFNVGVGFKHNEQYTFKLLNNFEKVAFVWDEETAVFLRRILEMVTLCFNEGCFDFTPNIRLIEIGFHKAETIEKALTESFNQVVTLS